jgi:hypothetical protein
MILARHKQHAAIETETLRRLWRSSTGGTRPSGSTSCCKKLLKQRRKARDWHSRQAKWPQSKQRAVKGGHSDRLLINSSDYFYSQ